VENFKNVFACNDTEHLENFVLCQFVLFCILLGMLHS